MNVPQYIHFHRITKGKDNTITSYIEDCQKVSFQEGIHCRCNRCCNSSFSKCIEPQFVYIPRNWRKGSYNPTMMWKGTNRTGCVSQVFMHGLVELALKVIMMQLLMLRQKKKRNSDIGDDDCSVINVENRSFPTPEHIEADGSDAFSAKYEKEKEVHIDVDDFAC